MSISKHLTYMLWAALGLVAVLTLTGVPLSAAVPYALVLACPLMMIGMMLMMGHGSGHGGCSHDHERDATPHVDAPTGSHDR